MKKLRQLKERKEKNSKKPSRIIFRKFLPMVMGAVALTFVGGKRKSKPKCPKPSEIEIVQKGKKDLVMKDKKLAKIVVHAVLKGLRSFDKKVRIDTAWALGRIGNAEAKKVLENILEKESSPEVQAEIEYALNMCNE